MSHDSRVTDGARTRDSRSHNPPPIEHDQALTPNTLADDARGNTPSHAGNRTGGGNAFVSPSRRRGAARPPGVPIVGQRWKLDGHVYTIMAVNDISRVARIWRLPDSGGGLELQASYDVLRPVGVMAGTAATRRERGLCTGCGEEPAVPGLVQGKACLQRRRDYTNQRIDVELECAACGAKQWESLRADAIMKSAVARAKCLFCGTKTMRRRSP